MTGLPAKHESPARRDRPYYLLALVYSPFVGVADSKPSERSPSTNIAATL